MNRGIKNIVKQCTTCLGHQQIEPKEKIILYKLPCKLWEVVSDETLSLKIKYLLPYRLIQ